MIVEEYYYNDNSVVIIVLSFFFVFFGCFDIDGYVMIRSIIVVVLLCV